MPEFSKAIDMCVEACDENLRNVWDQLVDNSLGKIDNLSWGKQSKKLEISRQS